MRTLLLAMLLLACLAVSRGFFRSEALAGHDSYAYYVSQSEFHENIREGVAVPRWHPDSRFGYGEVKLQQRPPLGHYLAESFIFLTGRRILGVHAAMVVIVFAAGAGMLLLLWRQLGAQCAAVGAIGYVTANYFLANLYLRGAWYEAAAYAAMPWILWANEELSRTFGSSPSEWKMKGCSRFRPRPLLCAAAACAWGALICGHPHTAAFFMPVALSHLIFRAASARSWMFFATASAAFVCGLMLSAPFWLAALLESSYSRLQLFDLGLECYYRHFLDLGKLFFEAWPLEYMPYTGAIDYLDRPVRTEMRGLNLWAVATFILAPLLWFSARRRLKRERALSMFFFFWALATIAISLPLSWGVWECIRPLQSFNFPWRSLGGTSLCLAVLVGLTMRHAFLWFKARPLTKASIAAALAALMIAGAYPHCVGWSSSGYPAEADLAPERIRATDGIPQHFHTPIWVCAYPTSPAVADVEVFGGSGKVENVRRGVTRWTFDVVAETPVVIRINHHYYPGWRFRLNAASEVEAQPSPTGLMLFEMPPGRHAAELRLESTPARGFCDGMAVVAALLLVAFVAVACVPYCAPTGRICFLCQ